MARVCKRFPFLRNFLLQHDQPSDFVHSVVCQSPIPYAVGVTCLTIHTLTMAIYTGVTSAYREKIFIWLTYWSFFTLTARFLCTTFNAWTYVYDQRKKRSLKEGSSDDCCSEKPEQESSEMPGMYKVQWVLQNMSNCSALIVSGLYWTVMYSPDKVESARSINSHCLNAVLVLGDVLLSRAPVRLHHFIYTFGFVTTYIFFSVIYWAAGGQNHLGDNYIYSLLDYSDRPGRAVAVVLAVDFVGTPLLQLILYAIFRLRQWVCGRCSRRKEAVLTVEVNTSSLSLGSKGDKRKSGEKDISLDNVSENLCDFGGRNYVLTSNRDEDVMIDVDLDFEMDAVPAVRPPLHTNNSQVSCTDSTKALLN